MKTILKISAGFFIVMLLIQLMDVGFYLMNQSDTYLFNLGIAFQLLICIVFIYLGYRLVDNEQKKDKQNDEEI